MPASDTVISVTNYAIAPAPPSAYYPSVNGQHLTKAYTDFNLELDTTGLPPSSPLGDFAVEFLVSGVWVQDVLVQGALTGPYRYGSMIWTVDGTIGVGQGRSAVRFRVDQCPGLTLASVTLTLT